MQNQFVYELSTFGSSSGIREQTSKPRLPEAPSLSSSSHSHPKQDATAFCHRSPSAFDRVLIFAPCFEAKAFPAASISSHTLPSLLYPFRIHFLYDFLRIRWNGIPFLLVHNDIPGTGKPDGPRFGCKLDHLSQFPAFKGLVGKETAVYYVLRQGIVSFPHRHCHRGGCQVPWQLVFRGG